jgi:Flp pilus assembly protein TadD
VLIYDDLSVIPVDPSIRKLWPVWDVLTAQHEPGSTIDGRPLVALSLAVSHATGGRPVHYHVFNLCVHLAAAMVLYGLIRRTLLLPGVPPSLGQRAAPIALASAVLWGVHPLTTAAVTYIIQRAESLAALCYLLTLYGLLRCATGRRPAVWSVAAVTACFLGANTKEIIVSAPIVCLLYDRAFLAGGFVAALRKRWRLYAALAGTWAMLAYHIISSGDRGGSVGFSTGAPMQYALTELGVIAHYLRLVLWPTGLVLDYGWPAATNWRPILSGAWVVVPLLAATCWATARYPRWAFGAGMFFLVLAPTSSFFPMADAAMDHRMYLPLACVTATVVPAVVLLVEWLMRASPARQGGRVFGGLAAGAAAIALGLAGMTHARNEEYHDAIEAWTLTIRRLPWPNQRAHHCLGWHLLEAGRSQEAMAQFDIAVALRPDDFTVLVDRGNLNRDLGRFDQAVADHTRAIALCPGQWEPWFIRSVTFYRAGRFDQAQSDLEQCLKLGGTVPESFRQALTQAMQRGGTQQFRD